MNYHMIRTDDMLNGSGLRVVIFLSGCDNRCEGCHNPETWDLNGKANCYTPEELIKKILNYKPYFKHNGGVTFSGTKLFWPGRAVVKTSGSD